MPDRIERLIADVAHRNTKLVLLVGTHLTAKSSLLNDFASHVTMVPLNVGSKLGARLAMLPQKQRHLETGNILRDLAEQHARGDLLLLDNIEILFDRTLHLDPLDLLKRHAHVRRVVLVWPGDLREGRLTYAEKGHPEHQDYGLDGLVTLEIH